MKKIIISVLALLLVVPLIGMAAEIRTGNLVSLSGTQASGDIYAAGANVSVTSAINGDLIIAGGTLSVTASTSESILAAGGTVVLRGQVGDDIRAAGGNVMVSGAIKNDVVVAGGQVSVDSEADIGGDAILTGGTVTLDGKVHDSAQISGGQVVINGIIDRDVSVKATKLTIGSGAVISGNLNYSSPDKANIASGAVIKGATNYTPITRSGDAKAESGAGAFLAWLIGGFLISFVSILVFFLILKRPTIAIVTETLSTFWKSVLTGLIVLIVTPIAALILCITILGLPLGLLLFFSYIILIILSVMLAPVVLGSYVYRWISKSDSIAVDWKIIALGVLILMVISYIPIIGWVFRFILMLGVMGALFRLLYALFKPAPSNLEPIL